MYILYTQFPPAIDLIVKYLAAHPWDGKMITDRIVYWLEEMKKRDESVITPIL